MCPARKRGQERERERKGGGEERNRDLERLAETEKQRVCVSKLSRTQKA